MWPFEIDEPAKKSLKSCKAVTMEIKAQNVTTEVMDLMLAQVVFLAMIAKCPPGYENNIHV